MSCPNCGGRVYPTDTHCMAYGNELRPRKPKATVGEPSTAREEPPSPAQEDSPPPRKAGQMIECSACGKLISVVADVCPHCGHKPIEEAAYVGGFVGALAGAAIGAFYGVVTTSPLGCAIGFGIVGAVIGGLVAVIIRSFKAKGPPEAVAQPEGAQPQDARTGREHKCDYCGSVSEGDWAACPNCGAPRRKE